jgi:hypothetical protein
MKTPGAVSRESEPFKVDDDGSLDEGSEGVSTRMVGGNCICVKFMGKGMERGKVVVVCYCLSEKIVKITAVCQYQRLA